MIYLFGIFIHSSSIIIILMPFLNIYKKIINNYYRQIWGALLCFSFVFYKYNILTLLLECIIKLRIPELSDKIYGYLYHSNEYSGVVHTLGKRDLKYIVVGIILIFIINYEVDFYTKVIITMFYFGIFLKFSLSFNIVLSDRISEAFLILESLIVGLIYKKNGKIYQKILYNILLSIILIYNLFQIILVNNYIVDLFY